MNDHTDDRLHDALADLPRAVPPSRDLWPDIAAQLGAQQPSAPHAIGAAPATAGAPAHQRRTMRRRLLIPALAAAAVLAVVLVGRRHDTPAINDGWRYLALASLEQDYTTVRGDVLQLLVTRCTDLPEDACADLRAGLDDLDRTVADLQRALRDASTDPSPGAGLDAGLGAGPWLTSQLQRALLQTRGLADLTQSLIRH